MLFNRIAGVFRLSIATFEDIEHDPRATGQAALVVGIVALLAAIGSGFGALFTEGGFFSTFLYALVWTYISWILVSLVVYIVGTAFFHGTADFYEMLRVIGFAYAPQMLAIIPCVGGIIGAIWSLVAGFIAVRQGLDIDDLRSLFTIVAGFALYLIGVVLINVFFGIFGIFT